MTAEQLRRIRREQLGLTQEGLASRLHTTRVTIARYESGSRHIPGAVEVAVRQLASSTVIPMAGIVAAGKPIEPVPQTELTEVPPSMASGGEVFALRVVGESMRDEGILPGDLVIVHKQQSARNGQTVVALLNNEATIKKYYHQGDHIELRPANPAMKPIVVTPQEEFQIQGVVTGIIRRYR